MLKALMLVAIGWLLHGLVRSLREDVNGPRVEVYSADGRRVR